MLQVPLQAVDLSHVSILYTQGDMAAITPIYDYNFQVAPLLSTRDTPCSHAPYCAGSGISFAGILSTA